MVARALFDIGNVMVEPTSTFSRLKAKPNAWVPLAVLILTSLAISYWWISTLDFSWLTDHVIASQGAAIKPEAREAMKKFMTRNTMLITSSVTVVLGTLLISAIAAVYYLLAGRVLGTTIGYGKWFGFSVWVSIPRLLTVPLSALQIATSGGRLAPEDLNMMSLNYLLLHLPASNPWATMAGSVDLTSLWSIALAILGLKAWTGRGTGTCAVAAVLPWVIVYGLWAAKNAFFG